MSSVASGSVSSSQGGTVLTYMDTGSYGTIISRTLNVYDANGNLFQGPFPMGASLTQVVDITTDQWLSFVCVVVDNTGTFTATVNYLAEGIYIDTFLNRIVSLGCSCQQNQFCDMFKGQLSLVAAEWFSIPGLGVPADTTIRAANIYVNTNNPNNL